MLHGYLDNAATFDRIAPLMISRLIQEGEGKGGLEEDVEEGREEEG